MADNVIGFRFLFKFSYQSEFFKMRLDVQYFERDFSDCCLLYCF